MRPIGLIYFIPRLSHPRLGLKESSFYPCDPLNSLILSPKKSTSPAAERWAGRLGWG